MKLRSKHPHYLFTSKVNPVIRFMIFSDIFIVGAAGMIGPLFALFVEEQIQGGTPLDASVALGLYLVSRSLLQIPIAQFIDRVRGENDDFWLMISFTIIRGVLPLLYLVVQTPIQLHLLQIAFGLSTAVTYPPYSAIFTRHLDKHKEGTEWSLYYSATDLSSAFLAILGGYLVEVSGFPALILTIAILSTGGGFLLLPIRRYLFQK